MQVPFGRYKGQDISVMVADTEYAKTQLESEAIREAFPDFVAALQEALNLKPTEPVPHATKNESTKHQLPSVARALPQHIQDFLPDVPVVTEPPKAAQTDRPEVPEPKVWRFEDSPEVQRRLSMGWRRVGERCVTDGTYFYSERVRWKPKEKYDE